MSAFQARVVALCEQAVAHTVGHPQHAEAAAILERATGPLRVAIAGRVKAGKSTLLNALVGERLAPTDAGECTFLVTEYREDLGYDVGAVLRDGRRVTLPFTREGGALDVSLGEVAMEDVDHLDVGWPSSALRDVTLIDTPGLASLTDDAQRRTLDFLGGDEDTSGRADAVIYLMRHLHRTDADFLETFADRSLANASPVNAIAVLSRVDEVGAGRLDAMDSARRIAKRYGTDPRVRALASRVVPVAGLLAETGLTLRQDEYANLAVLAAHQDRDELLVSVDHFVRPDLSPVAPEARTELIGRLGLFGARTSLAAIADGRVTSGPALSRYLIEVSGLPALTELLEGHFTQRAAALKGRSALAALRTLVTTLDDDAGIGRAIEELESTSHELGELRLVHLLLAGATRLADDEVEAAMLACSSGSPAQRLGAEDHATAEGLQSLALVAVDRWRTRRAHPMIDPPTAEACDLLARAHEGLYATLVAN